MNASRYEGLGIVPAGPLNERPEVAPRLLLDPAQAAKGRGTYEYTVVQGDRIDVLAYQALGDSRLWWVIADLNPDVDPLRLQGGQIIVLPALG